jgi:hypothetical protein
VPLPPRSQWQAKGAARNSPIDPRNEPGQSAVGCSPDPRRAPQVGIEIGQTSVAKYMTRYSRPPSQGWKTFLRNHADGIASMDLFVFPTLSFRLLYGLLILSHGRRQILWLGVTTHPTAEWWPSNSSKPAAGNGRRTTSSAIATLSTAKFLPGGFAPWAFGIGQPRHARHGRTDIRSG